MDPEESFSEEELDAAEQRLRDFAENPNFISGIYNYCDRWCERCPMTSRCMLFAQEAADRKLAAGRDAENRDFWREVAKNFAVTQRIILKDAQERGIDLSDLDTREIRAEVAKRKARRTKAKSLGTTKAAMRYVDSVDEWFKLHEGQFERKAHELRDVIQADIPARNPMAEFNFIEDAVEIIRWYQHQIYVKLARALSGLRDAEDEDPGGEFGRHDADGSAKVALIGIDRSIAAWASLREHFADDRDRILDTLVLLDRLRRDVETILPNARHFKRPGLDEMPGE